MFWIHVLMLLLWYGIDSEGYYNSKYCLYYPNFCQYYYNEYPTNFDYNWASQLQLKSPKSQKLDNNCRGDRPGSCCKWPWKCSRPYNRISTAILECDADCQCPDAFKCCKNSCFTHKVCMPAVYKSIDHTTTVTSSATTATVVFSTETVESTSKIATDSDTPIVETTVSPTTSETTTFFPETTIRLDGTSSESTSEVITSSNQLGTTEQSDSTSGEPTERITTPTQTKLSQTTSAETTATQTAADTSLVSVTQSQSTTISATQEASTPASNSTSESTTRSIIPTTNVPSTKSSPEITSDQTTETSKRSSEAETTLRIDTTVFTSDRTNDYSGTTLPHSTPSSGPEVTTEMRTSSSEISTDSTTVPIISTSSSIQDQSQSTTQNTTIQSSTTTSSKTETTTEVYARTSASISPDATSTMPPSFTFTPKRNTTLQTSITTRESTITIETTSSEDISNTSASTSEPTTTMSATSSIYETTVSETETSSTETTPIGPTLDLNRSVLASKRFANITSPPFAPAPGETESDSTETSLVKTTRSNGNMIGPGSEKSIPGTSTSGGTSPPIVSASRESSTIDITTSPSGETEAIQKETVSMTRSILDTSPTLNTSFSRNDTNTATTTETVNISMNTFYNGTNDTPPPTGMSKPGASTSVVSTPAETEPGFTESSTIGTTTSPSVGTEAKQKETVSTELSILDTSPTLDTNLSRNGANTATTVEITNISMNIFHNGTNHTAAPTGNSIPGTSTSGRTSHPIVSAPGETEPAFTVSSPIGTTTPPSVGTETIPKETVFTTLSILDTSPTLNTSLSRNDTNTATTVEITNTSMNTFHNGTNDTTAPTDDDDLEASGSGLYLDISGSGIPDDDDSSGLGADDEGSADISRSNLIPPDLLREKVIENKKRKAEEFYFPPLDLH